MTAVRVKESFSFDLDGVPQVVRAGEIMSDDDARYKGREHFFETADEAASNATNAVETASAAPSQGRILTSKGRK